MAAMKLESHNSLSICLQAPLPLFMKYGNFTLGRFVGSMKSLQFLEVNHCPCYILIVSGISGQTPTIGFVSLGESNLHINVRTEDMLHGT